MPPDASRNATTPLRDEGGRAESADNDLRTGNPGNHRGGPASRDGKR